MGEADEAARGHARAAELLALLDGEAGDEAAARALLGSVTELRELAFLGAGLTVLARAEGRALPPAQRAQAATRQVHLGTLRDRVRADPAGLRVWLLRAAEEIRQLRDLRAAADRLGP